MLGEWDSRRRLVAESTKGEASRAAATASSSASLAVVGTKMAASSTWLSVSDRVSTSRTG